MRQEGYVEEIFEEKVNEEILEGNYDGNKAYILFYPVCRFYEPKPNQVDEIEIYVSSRNEKVYNLIVDKYGLPNKKSRSGYRWRIPYDFPSVVQFGNKFAFNGMILECDQDEDGYYIIPSFLKEEFRKEFPTTYNYARSQKLQHIQYTGKFPTYCSGDTVLQFENCKITTKILSCGGAYVFEDDDPTPVKWCKDVPEVLKDIEKEILKELKPYTYTYCCGGCE